MDRILGLGNALTDVSVALKDDDILLKMGLPKGGMTHIDETTFSRINQVLGTLDTTITPGGSVGNACRAMAHLGLSTGFIGKVGRDAFGREESRERIRCSVLTQCLKPHPGGFGTQPVHDHADESDDKRHRNDIPHRADDRRLPDRQPHGDPHGNGEAQFHHRKHGDEKGNESISDSELSK